MSDYGTPPPPPPSAPGYNQPTAGGTPPPNYLVWAILSTIFCCLPLGIASIVFAAQVDGVRLRRRRRRPESSAKARRFAMIAAVVGIVVNGLYFAFVLPNLSS